MIDTNGSWKLVTWVLAVALGLAGAAGSAHAQSTPTPVPAGPGTPIYVQPTPLPGSRPADTPDPVPSTEPARIPDAAKPAESSRETPKPPRQITSFPELTRGVGNSQALLED